MSFSILSTTLMVRALNIIENIARIMLVHLRQVVQMSKYNNV